MGTGNRALQYVQGWDYCVRCGTFRPERQLSADGDCKDLDWCKAQAKRRRKELGR